MANTRQQRKRVRIAERENRENLRFKSRIKTMFRSLTVASQEDDDRAAELGIELVSVIDKAAAKGVIHKRNAAKKKARVYSIVKLPEGKGKTKETATTGAANEKSKAQRRAERRVARKTKKDEARTRQQARAQAEAEAAAAEAEPEAEEAAEETAEEVVEEAAEETAEAVEEEVVEEVEEAAEETAEEVAEEAEADDGDEETPEEE